MSNYELIRLKRSVSSFMFKLCNELFFSTAFNTPCICPKIRYDDYWQASHLFLFLNQEAGADCSVFERNKRPFKKRKKKRDRRTNSAAGAASPPLILYRWRSDPLCFSFLDWILLDLGFQVRKPSTVACSASDSKPYFP